MKNTRFLLPLLISLLGIGLIGVAPTAHAATKNWAYQATAGATYIQLADATLSSDLTAESTVTGGPATTRSNSTTAVKVGSALQTGAVTTRSSAARTATTTTLTSWSRTADVNLLAGLVRIDAVTTRVTTKATTSGTVTSLGNTQFAGIHIAGLHLPVNIPQNYAATIPGVADVRLNYFRHGATASSSVTLGWAVSLRLLQGRQGVPAGALVVLNPSSQFLNDIPPSPGAKLGGMSFGTQIKAHTASLAQLESGPTAFLGTPYGGSKGQTLSRNTAAVNVPGVLHTGAVTTTSTSTKDKVGNADIRNTSEIAGLNLLAGVVRADAIKVVAHGRVKNGVWTSGMSMTTVNLVIAGHAIPVNVGPNTTINVAGLGKVQLNYRAASSADRSNQIDAVRIVLSTAQAGLPAGAVIELAAAATRIH